MRRKRQRRRLRRQLAPRTQQSRTHERTQYCSAAPPAAPDWPSYEERLACVDIPSAALDRVLHMDGAQLSAFLAEMNAPGAAGEALLMRVAARQNFRLLNLLFERRQERDAAATKLKKAKLSRQLKRERDTCCREERDIKSRSSYMQSVKWYD